MTALILTEEFIKKATDAGQRLLASGDSSAEMSDPKGYFVALKGHELPAHSVQIATIEIEGKEVSIFTLG